MFLIPQYYPNILLIACILYLYIAYLAWTRRATPGSRVLFFLMLSMALWAFGASSARTAGELDEKILWGKITYIGLCSTPPLIILFNLVYTRSSLRLRKQYIAVLFIIPIITLLLAFTNERHSLLWSNVTVIPEMNAIIFHHGPWFYIFIAYAYLTTLLSTIIFLRSTILHRYIRPSLAFTLALGLLFPWAANLIYALDLNPLRGLDLTPVAFVITGFILIWSIYGLKMLDLTPIAREKVIDSMFDCLLVVDEQGRIVDINPAMHKCISKLQKSDTLVERSNIIGFAASYVMKNCPKLVSVIHSVNEKQSEIDLYTETETSYYDMEITPILDNRKNKIGKMILLRDITPYKRAVQAEAEARGMAEALQEAGTALASTLEFDHLMELIITMIGRVLTFDSANVLLLDDELLLVSAVNGLAESMMKVGDTVSIYGHPNYEVLKQEKTIVYPDITKDYPFIQDGIHSLISAPLISHQKIIGFLNLASIQPNCFTEKDIEKLNAFAVQVSIALENARLYQEAQRRLTEQSILNEISRSISTRLDLSEFLERVYQQIKLYVNIQNFSVARYDESSNEWEFVYIIDTIQEQNQINQKKHKPEAGLTGYVIQNRSPLLLNSENELLEFQKHTKRRPLWQNLKSWMGVPLIVGERIVGVMATHHYDQEKLYSHHDFNLFIMISSQIAVAFENAHLFAKMEEMAITDTLTGLYNRRHLFYIAEHEMVRSTRYQTPISIIMFDIDHFKNVNDTYGHTVGDQVLQQVAGVCRHTLRKTDIVGRYGGEEFLILLPETGLLDALEVAERLRQNIQDCTIDTKSGKIQITVSLGLTSQNKDYAATFTSLLEEADQAMYRAKQKGRDQVQMFTDHPPEDL